jgi:UDP-N-acetylmuramoyl-L-alanyl-D-glutamate--2,6-diaminopimelate ligase
LEGDTVSVTAAKDIARLEISGLTCDSRRVEPGFLFAALPGSRADGRAYIAEAVERGAVAVLAPPGDGDPGAAALLGRREIPLVSDDNPRRRLALMAARFFSRQPQTVAAVTGTNGKTSVVWFLRQIWTQLGHKAASLGTLGIDAPGVEVRGSLTTPDPVELHRALARLADDNVDCLAMEASSHGLAQHRLDGVRIEAAAFTNLSRDHLDYHRSESAYFQAKLRLFSELVAGDGTAVINADAPNAEAVEVAATGRGLSVITFGVRGHGIRLDRTKPTRTGQDLTVTVDGAQERVLLPLVGDFQALNALCALGLAIATGAAPRVALATLETLRTVPGRLETVGQLDNGASVYVDYAHTPEALASVLKALRPQVRGRLCVVFGCGGDRDRGKRPEMGRVAGRLADAVIVTDDNPRNEPPDTIRQQIRASVPGARDIADRAEAIAVAISDLRAGDILVIAGKGHETGQIVGDRVLAFDDANVARAAIAEVEN